MGVGVKIAQAVLIAFNFIFVLIGLAGIIAGAVIQIKYDDYIHLTSRDVGGVSILMIVIGSIIFIIAFMGCCGAIRKSTVMLTIYIILLVIILIIEIAGAITAYVFKHKLKDYVEDGLDHAMNHYNDTDDKYRDAFDTMQEELECCGKNNTSDWLKHNLTIPKSCCPKKKLINNGTTCLENSAYDKGCVDALFDYLEDHLAIIGGLGIGVAVIQVIGIIFACLVRHDVKEGYGYV